MNKLCRQVSIESPGPTIKDSVFSFEVPIPDVPPDGARIKVVYAGACYRLRKSTSVSSLSSTSSGDGQQELAVSQTTVHCGVRDGALYAGYEVSGVIESLGENVQDNAELKVGDKVVLYPYEGVPHGYAEFVVVPELQYLIKIPSTLQLSVATMLPTGALLALNTVTTVRQYVENILKNKGEKDLCKILIVGTGGLAFWTLRIAAHQFQTSTSRVSITVASLKDEGLLLAKEHDKVNIVQWNEDVYEKQLIERTKDACKGKVDIVIDYGTTSRSLHRSLQCLHKGGAVFISHEVAERLLPKFSRRAEERQQTIRPVDMGSIDQLKELVSLVDKGEIEPPPVTVFPAEQAGDAIRKLCQSDIRGQAILQFLAID